ncbi:MAG: hypothetical protein SPI30_08710 [Prevotella sp.]|nr:hypothetical protein [Prevotella sp.]
MRKELYEMLVERLSMLYTTADGFQVLEDPDAEIPEGGERAIKHIDLWNHNVEFIEQEESWERPAVFVEFAPIQWQAIQVGVEYRAEPTVNLHVVTDWTGSVSAGSEFREESLKVFDMLEEIHKALTCMEGETFMEFDLVESRTNHNHEEIIENIESYQCVAIKSL